MQFLFVTVCLLLAILFMGRKIYRTLKNRQGCGCDCAENCKNKTPSCYGGGECHIGKGLKELKPK